MNGFCNKKRNNGKVRYYFRRRGSKPVPLTGLPGSEEFMAQYATLLAGIPDQEPRALGASRTQPGTIDALCVSYLESTSWTTLADDTRLARFRIIEKFRLKHGNKRVRMLGEPHVIKMMGEIKSLSGKRSWLKTIRHLLQHAVPTMIRKNPAEGIAQVKLPKSKGHHTWTDDEIATYRAFWPYGTQQRLVMEFALETVSRRGEVVRLGPQHISHGRIRIERTHGSEDVDIPVSGDLQAACDAMPKKHLTYIVTAYGKPRSKFGLGTDFAEWARAAGLPDRCRMHGLKKSGMRRRAEVGNTAHELMAFSGHKTLTEVQRYTEAANKKRLADSGAAKMRQEQSENGVVTNKVVQKLQTARKSLK
ncbi:tyrosine-type recombinase/integrase [Bradyrhizobium sp. CAR08]